MTDTYKGGYKKALLDILNLLEYHDFFGYCKSKKQMMTTLKSLLRLCLSSPKMLEILMEKGDIVGVVLRNEDKAVISLK